jgi:hypothetical protein
MFASQKLANQIGLPQIYYSDLVSEFVSKFDEKM